MRMKDTCYDKFIDQIFYNINFPGAIPYIPRLYNNISKSCADSLSSWDVEKLQCPACPDSFLIPTSFFQHLYRKSCEIMFKCKLCDDVLTFFNRCALKVHFLSHMELDSSVSSIEIDHALLRPPRGMDHMHQTNNTVLESFSKELFNKDKIQCPECHLCIENVLPHMTKKHKILLQCKACPMILPNECSLSSHSRIHQGIGPYVCPECGDEFQTLSIFKEHVLDYCLHEYRTLIYTCPLRHKEKKHFALNPSNLLEHINDHHVKLLYKCSYCSRAFTKESAIHIHLKEEHSNIPEYLTEKEDFTLLYKTLISKERRIFGKKESFESAFLLVAEKQWKSEFFFKCPACNELFKDKEILREHGIKWCRLQKSSSDAAVSSPILFPLEKANNVPLSSSHGNENFCNKENCLKCTEIFDLIQKHKHDCVTGDNEGNEQIESYSDVERSNTPSQKVDRSRLRSTYISEEVSSFSNHGSEFNEEEEIDVTDEPTSAPRKRGRKPKVKPLVEVLGLNVPSSKSILHFNRLHKQAMSLGSTVLPKRMRTSLHNCSLCDYKSNDRLSFLAHIKEHSEKYDNSSNTFLQCKECGMSFASEPSWKKHLFLIHRIRHPAPSDYLTDLTHLDEDSGDRRLVIDEDRANVCQVCSRSFDSPKDLKKHSRGHGVSPLVSQNRKRSFTST
nr:zinc finger protein 592-like [Lepeophtheirus salmonis]